MRKIFAYLRLIINEHFGVECFPLFEHIFMFNFSELSPEEHIYVCAVIYKEKREKRVEFEYVQPEISTQFLWTSENPKNPLNSTKSHHMRGKVWL